MIRRRRRRNREIAFGLDSFLDVIANVIGIIIRMIIVVWVGASSYHELRFQQQPARVPPLAAKPEKIEDPLEKELEKHRQQLQQAQQTLLAELRQLPPLEEKQKTAQQQLQVVAAAQQTLAQQQEGLTQALLQQDQTAQGLQISLVELNERSENLKKEIAQLHQQPLVKKTIRYRTPVSRLVESEELIFECQGGRVAFLDMAALKSEMIEDVRNRIKDLKQFGKVEGVTGQIGAFRLRYALQRPPLGALAGGGNVDALMLVEPLAALRGETLAEAFQPTSEFRQIVDFADPKQAVITFCVYPDSFALFRQLRDYLYQRDLEVAARPLPHGQPIGFSPHGTASRSQ